MYYIYLIENLLDARLYIGLTVDPVRRWKRHKSTARNPNVKRRYYLHNSMASTGEDNFEFTIIQTCDSKEEAQCIENYWVTYLKSNGFSLYNLTDGGESHPMLNWTDDMRKEASKRMSGENNYFYGKKLSGEANGHYGKKMKPHVREILLQHRAKLTQEQVQQIRELYATGNYTQADLCRQFDMSCAQIHRIVKGKRWVNL